MGPERMTFWKLFYAAEGKFLEFKRLEDPDRNDPGKSEYRKKLHSNLFLVLRIIRILDSSVLIDIWPKTLKKLELHVSHPICRHLLSRKYLVCP